MLRCLLLAALLALPVAAPAATVMVAEMQGAISPPAADYFLRALAEAERSRADLLVVRMDTPGGLDTAMRRIIQGILAARVPVAVYVAPSGARAASAGTYILYASHVAAMAPGTNLGAATPVAVGGGGPDKGPAGKEEKDKGADKDRRSPGSAMESKAVHDAAAYLRSLAQLRGRNAQWAEKAVRDAESLSAGEARDLKVIDLVAADLPELLKAIDGRRVKVGNDTVRLAVADARTVAFEPNWKEKLLSVIADPNIALILMMVGIYGLIFEFLSPGMVAPGVIGGISLLLGLYGLALLPVNFAGAALIVLGIALMAAEAFVPSFGILGIGGVVAFTVGAFMLMDAEVPGLELSWELVVPLAIVSALVLAGIGAYALRSRRRPVVTGSEAMAGSRVEALEDIREEGWVRLGGEQWRARTKVPLPRGGRGRVVRVEGLTLIIEPEGE
jgi:membrane-bound serine protease (ClpP class)